MILNEFPDLAWLKQQISQGFASRQGWGGRILKDQGWPNVILHARTNEVKRNNILGPLSLFTNIRGVSSVQIEGGPVRINPGFFFLSNPGQCYSLEINQEAAPTETFNVHFGEYFADQVMTALLHTPEFLLEHRFEKPQATVNFYNRLYPKDGFTDRLIASLHSGQVLETIFEEEQLFQLLAHLLKQQSQLKETKDRIPALKASTREEIIKRLFASTDYIYSFFDQNLSLSELAQVSCLSKFHFLRLFKIAFNETPHQFITKVRIQNAKDLLQCNRLEVADVARQVGFENASSFSRLFYIHTGVYPSQFQA